MHSAPPFDRSVFINCPFDEAFAPLLQAIAFCVVHLGFFPRIAPENADNAVPRLERITEIIRGSKFGIHDLSRCRAAKRRDFARMNMPFELGIDYAAARFGHPPLNQKTILILEQSRYDYQKALSDISGLDIECHGGSPKEASVRVRNWLVAQAGAPGVGPSKISGDYLAFQDWYWERELAAGSSEADIKRYPTTEVIAAMHIWKTVSG